MCFHGDTEKKTDHQYINGLTCLTSISEWWITCGSKFNIAVNGTLIANREYRILMPTTTIANGSNVPLCVTSLTIVSACQYILYCQTCELLLYCCQLTLFLFRSVYKWTSCTHSTIAYIYNYEYRVYAHSTHITLPAHPSTFIIQPRITLWYELNHYACKNLSPWRVRAREYTRQLHTFHCVWL